MHSHTTSPSQCPHKAFPYLCKITHSYAYMPWNHCYVYWAGYGASGLLCMPLEYKKGNFWCTICAKVYHCVDAPAMLPSPSSISSTERAWIWVSFHYTQYLSIEKYSCPYIISHPSEKHWCKRFKMKENEKSCFHSSNFWGSYRILIHKTHYHSFTNLTTVSDTSPIRL